MEYRHIEALYRKKEFGMFEDGRLNIFGVRTQSMFSNLFADDIGVAIAGENPVLKMWPATTISGTTYVRSPMNPKGTAILAPGQHIGAWQLGLHNGRYEALVQTGGEVRVFRDNNRDLNVDKNPDTLDHGYFGINIHHAAGDAPSQSVDGWSAGCQVFQDPSDFTEFLLMCKENAAKFGYRNFSYTLFEISDFQLIVGME